MTEETIYNFVVCVIVGAACIAAIYILNEIRNEVLLPLIRRIRYKLEFKKKCLKTKPCQCCAYWNVRKEYCALQKQLRYKHKIFD